MEDLWHETLKNIGYIIVVIVFVLITWLKSFIEKKFASKRLKKELLSVSDIKIHSILHEILTEFRFSTDAARVSIIQFHNGDYFYNGSPILKFSVSHESCVIGISPTMDSIQDLYLSRYFQLVELAEQPLQIYYTDEIKESNFRGFMESKNTIAFCLIPIKCQKNMNIMGIISIEWCSKTKSDQINKEKVFETCEKYTRLIKNKINNEGQFKKKT